MLPPRNKPAKDALYHLHKIQVPLQRRDRGSCPMQGEELPRLPCLLLATLFPPLIQGKPLKSPVKEMRPEAQICADCRRP